MIIEAIMEASVAKVDALLASEATEAVKLLIAQDFVIPDMRRRLVQALNHKVSGSAVNQTKCGKINPQTCPNIGNLMPQHLWTLICDPKTPYNQILMGMHKFAASIGLIAANEPTYVLMAAIVLLAQTPRDFFNIDLTEAYKLLKDLKSAIKLDRKRVGLPHHGKILIYPKTPEELNASYPEIFKIAYPDIENHPENAPGKRP